MGERHLQRNKSIIVDLFQGQLKSKVVCPDCSNTSVTFDPFMFLSIPVPDRNVRVPLDDCFRDYSKEETLNETEAWYCRECKKHQCASKKIDVWTLPDTLIIHLKRFSFTETSRKKVETFVDFPIDGLDMSNYIANRNVEQKQCIFDLFAVSNHFGNLGGGHYTAYAQNLTDNNWYDLDDSSVRRQSASAAKTQNAYVLFYQRRASKTLSITSSLKPSTIARIIQ